jgi:hypothetical protein
MTATRTGTCATGAPSLTPSRTSEADSRRARSGQHAMYRALAHGRRTATTGARCGGHVIDGNAGRVHVTLTAHVQGVHMIGRDSGGLI